MLNDRVQSIPRLQSALAKAEDYLSKLRLDAPFEEFEYVYNFWEFASSILD